ncbi:hypothetical protein [Oceanospirillum beijerinckii]|uniref:hypothetical protein n=1 Tax=Oceanospirillum beijerinckii TaxID=64976 RepID=UPI000417EC73|nr:hypothetical protein [Oceanospirillum beijerinckii]
MQRMPKLNLSVMLVDNEPARAAILEQALLDAGYRIASENIVSRLRPKRTAPSGDTIARL